ncbi:O-methyltransferase [Aridibaculum aurantiacum]|uniref:O-methyltransferase n=1 Tax=Aridibaculum aurantiacum TaxID=2810307 RepID=UPI001A959B54|nr:O-methyltransferase [Aridibaculum aurantiacum]
MELINALAEQYAELHTSASSEVLQQIQDDTNKLHPHAHMLSGHVQGRFLSFISSIIQPKYVLEIGTFTGYSALCLAEGLQPGGQVHTVEIREQDAAISLKNFMTAEKNNEVVLHLGDARDIIPSLPYHWDLVFIDADKVSYIEYYELVVPRLTNNGIIIADNVLFHGQVLEEPVKGKNALAIDAFNKHVAKDDRVVQVMLTLRDGLLLIKKK